MSKLELTHFSIRRCYFFIPVSDKSFGTIGYKDSVKGVLNERKPYSCIKAHVMSVSHFRQYVSEMKKIRKRGKQKKTFNYDNNYM